MTIPWNPTTHHGHSQKINGHNDHIDAFSSCIMVNNNDCINTGKLRIPMMVMTHES
jgi:hypothetical protein